MTYDPAMETAMINSPYSFETVIVRSWGPWTAGTLEKHDVTVDEFKHTGGKISSLRVEVSFQCRKDAQIDIIGCKARLRSHIASRWNRQSRREIPLVRQSTSGLGDEHQG